jgi:hypothetical protein
LADPDRAKNFYWHHCDLLRYQPNYFSGHQNIPIIETRFHYQKLLSDMESFGFPLSETFVCWSLTRKLAKVKADFRAE